MRMGFFQSITAKLILINVIVFFLEFVYPPTIELLSLTPTLAIYEGMYWQFFTFMFVHAGIAHILLNMFILMMFGMRIESVMGKWRFLIYYLITGVGSGVFHILLTGISDVMLLGASGAVFGILTAFGLMFPRQIVYVNFFFPMPAIVFVVIMGVIQLVYGISGSQPGIANFGHLGGMIVGVILLKFFGFGKKRRRRRVRYFWE